MITEKIINNAKLRSGKEKKISQMIPGIRISVVELFEFEELRHMLYEGHDLIFVSEKRSLTNLPCTLQNETKV